MKEVGLLGGDAGIALLFAYLSKAFPGKAYGDMVIGRLNGLGDALSNAELPYNMSGGIAGVAFVFQHLRNIGVLDKSDDLNLEELDEFISRGVDHDRITGNWDPLHGMVGLGIYFLERNRETGETTYLEKIVDHLAAMRTSVNNHGVWITPGYGKYSNDNYNLGTAHGMPGLLCFLAQVHVRGIKRPEIEEMVSSCLPFLLSHQLTQDSIYCFPTAVDVQPKEKEPPEQSRLGWCYGDLCMAFALIHCGKALQHDDWMQRGINVALKTTHRTFETAGCTDAPFCHGTVGLAHLYKRLHRLTGNAVFETACEKWFQITQEQFYKPNEGAGGYYFRTFNEEKGDFKLTANYSLLEGSAGIALVYLSYLHDITPDWDVVFLANV